MANTLEQRMVYLNGRMVTVGLTGDLGYIAINDTNIYPDGDSREQHKETMIPLINKADLKALKVAIDEVLTNSK